MLIFFKQDLERLTRKPASLYHILKLLLINISVQSVALFRLQMYFTQRHRFFLAKVLRNLNIYLTGADYAIGAIIGPGLITRHPNGIVVGQGAVIGKNCTILQQVTLGERYGEHDQLNPNQLEFSKYPTVGNNVIIGAGAKLIGSITIGDNVSIGANAVVIHDIQSNSIAVGIPAKVVTRLKASNLEIRVTS